jgi:hypothetical protein
MLDLAAVVQNLTDAEKQELFNLLLDSDIARHLGQRNARQVFKQARERCKGKLKKLVSAFAKSPRANEALDIFYTEMQILGLWPGN